MFIFLLLERHWVGWDSKSVTFPNWNRPKQDWNQTGPTTRLMQDPFYIIIEFTSAVTQWCHEMMSQSSASSFRGGKPLHMCSRVMQTHLCSHRHPHPTPPYTLHKLLSKFHIPIPTAGTLSPRYFGAPSYWSLIKSITRQIWVQK